MIDKGLLETPRLTTAQRDAISLAATDTGVIFNTSTSSYEVWNGSAWSALAQNNTGAYVVRGSTAQGGAVADVVYDTVLSNPLGLTRTNTSVTLTAGLWHLQAITKMDSMDVGDWISISIVDSANALLPTANPGIIVGSLFNGSEALTAGPATAIIQVAGTQIVKVRIMGVNGTVSVRAAHQFFYALKVG